MTQTQARTRVERDSMGPVEVPADAYYGGQTMRAVHNFPISSLRFPRAFIKALGQIKLAAAQVNVELGLLDPRLGTAIVQAAQEVVDGRHDSEFVVDIFQTGSGTSTNMNANEVIANRAIEILGGERGSKKPVHPNDHVHKGQSSNDVIPTTIHLAALVTMQNELVPALEKLEAALRQKAREFMGVVKTGRTHLQDATPIRLGQEFEGYADQIKRGRARVRHAQEEMSEVALGGTAVASGALNTLAVSLMKIANDIRWLGSGPRAGIGEIALPEVQPGSSIMPGKVNPVIPESVCMVCAQVMGNDVTITIGGQAGTFEINVMMPVVAYNLLQSIALLAAASDNFVEQCIVGLKATERGPQMVERGLAICTALAPHIGYDAAAEIAKEAARSGRTIREVARERTSLSEEELTRILDPLAMTEPGNV